MKDAMIYMRCISLEVVIPEEYVWNFMAMFGEAFKEHDIFGASQIKPVDSYHDHLNGWHVTLTIHESQEKKFNDFFLSFCASHGITLR